MPVDFAISRRLVLTRSIDNHSGGGEDGNLPTLCHPPIETGGGEVLGQGYLDNPPNENGEEFSGDTCYLGHCHTTPHPELEWLWENPGRAIWLRKNPGRAFLAAEKPWAGYFGCRKTWAGDILAADKPCAHAHSGNLTYRLCIWIHRRPSEEQFCEARIP